ncbi:MAG: SGNH/GDSL hydrolase family protein [Candidatus Thorarchaeota archaeon]
MNLLMDFQILCIGDSHTAGFPEYDPSHGGNPESTYEFWLHNSLIVRFPALRFSIENRGICGLLAYQVYPVLKARLKRNRPDLVILWAGANDLASMIDTRSIWNSLWEIFELSKANQVPFCMVTIPPMAFKDLVSPIKRLNQKIIENADGNYLCADIYYPLASNDRLDHKFTIGDGVHLSIQGYRLVGGIIYNVIEQKVSMLVGDDDWAFSP